MIRTFCLDIQVEFAGTFHITGPGRSVPLLDRPIQVDERGHPMIPGSSLRGRVRTTCERFMRAMNYPVCYPPRPERMCPHAGLQLPNGQKACRVCQIFGSAWYPSPVVFEDLHVLDRPETEDFEERVHEQRIQVSISRRLGTVQAERLFVSETASWQANEKLRFRGKITGFLDIVQAGWLLIALTRVTHVGGDKASGLGLMEIRPVEWRWWDETRARWEKVDDPSEFTRWMQQACDGG